jgi:pimeloyl-ACP methyl ester carboxylesterase
LIANLHSGTIAVFTPDDTALMQRGTEGQQRLSGRVKTGWSDATTLGPMTPGDHDARPFQPGSSAPDWLRRNLCQPGLSRFIEIDGALIHYLSWDWHRRDLPALVFVHGFRGHARWWSFLVPFFLQTHRVAAIDLSNMGDSEHRTHCDGLRHALDIAGFIRRFDLAPATVIGHSYGGSRTLRAAAERPEAIGRAIIVDTYVNFPDWDTLPTVRPVESRWHADRALAQARFRLLPPQPTTIEDLVRYVAHHSVCRRPQGWCWKFDPCLTNDEENDGPAMLTRVHAKVDYVHGEASAVVNAGRARRIFQMLPNARRLTMLPGAHHHPMLDRPLELVASLRRLLA